MTAIRRTTEDHADRAAHRERIARMLRPYVDGTAPGMASSLLTEARVAATARDAAEAVLPLLGVPAPSAHRVRGLIVPALLCGWPELDTVFERVLDKLLALPPAHPDVPEPTWDAQLPEPRPSRPEPTVDAPAWSPSARDGDTVVGPSGTTGTL